MAAGSEVFQFDNGITIVTDFLIYPTRDLEIIRSAFGLTKHFEPVDNSKFFTKRGDDILFKDESIGEFAWR